MTILDCSMMQNSFLSIPRFLRYMHRSGIRTEYNRVQFFVMKILKSIFGDILQHFTHNAMPPIFLPDQITPLGSHSFYISFGSESDTSHRFSFNLDSKTHRFTRHGFYHTDVIECILFGIGMRKIIH